MELDQADVGDAIKCEAAESRVSYQFGVGSGDVQRNVFPYLHVDFFDVQVFEGVVDQVQVGFDS